MKIIQATYLVRDVGPPKYYLGNDFFRDKEGHQYMGSSTYVVEALRKIESKVGNLTPERSACAPGDHPELDETPPCDLTDTRTFQGLLGVAQWIVMLGRIDIAQAVMSLSRFNAAPRAGHLKRAYRIFSYLKRRKHLAIRLDPRAPLIDHGSLRTDKKPDFSAIYPDAAEELDSKLPEPLGPELDITALMDADHAHDYATRRSVSGIILFVGRTPVVWMSKRQSSTQASTYGAEFMAARATTEEILSLCYFLRSFGVPVTRAARIFGDNMSVLLNISSPDSQLKKKHLCIAYHILRENCASSALEPFYVPSNQNYSDFLTKGLSAVLHDYHTYGLLYGLNPASFQPTSESN